jgi:hypothetical protein
MWPLKRSIGNKQSARPASPEKDAGSVRALLPGNGYCFAAPLSGSAGTAAGAGALP